MTIKLKDIISKVNNMSNKRKFVIGLLFLIIVSIFFLRSKEDSSQDGLSSKSRIPVVLTPSQLMVFEDLIVVQGADGIEVEIIFADLSTIPACTTVIGG